MNIELAYGKRGLVVNLPAAAQPTVIRKPAVAIPPDPAHLVAEALREPIGSPSLEQLAVGCRSACILVCDITRPVPNHLFLRPIIERLLKAGLVSEKITVLIATGLHRPNEGEELAELIGDPWVLERVSVVNHHAFHDQEHVDLGTTPIRATPVRLDRRFVTADLKIATGLVEPHFMAGYSGGRKVIAPGIAHEETIRTFHNAQFMQHPATRPCNLHGNWLHEEQLKIVRMLGQVYALNTVIDEQRRLIHVTFGEVIKSHLAAVDFVRISTEVSVPRRFKTVVTSSAGYPLDTTYYQTVKGMVTPIDILEPGGTLIVASECSQGLGSDAFRRSQEQLIRFGPDAFLKWISRKRLANIDEWESQMQLKATRIGQVQLYSEGLSAEEHRLTGVTTVKSLEKAVAFALRVARDQAIAVIPEGPYVVPFCHDPHQHPG